MATTTRLMTVEQYRELPETGPFYYELRRGELVQVARPKWTHESIQDRLHERLKEAGIPRSTMYKSLKTKNPTLKTLAKIMYVAHHSEQSS